MKSGKRSGTTIEPVHPLRPNMPEIHDFSAIHRIDKADTGAAAGAGEGAGE